MNFFRKLQFGGVIQIQRKTVIEPKGFVVRPVGFEPTTFCSGGNWSAALNALFAVLILEVHPCRPILGQVDLKNR